MKAIRRRLAVATALFAAACGGSSRTSPATQPSPAAFNAAGSDPKALALVDQALAGLGGRAEWDKVKQLQWDQRYQLDGKLLGVFHHAWDRWNGRHRFENVNVESIEKAKREGRPDDVQVTVTMYDLFDHNGKGTATVDGQMLDSATRDQAVAAAYKSFQADSYRLTAVFKLKDPGVKLALKEPIQPLKEFCKPGCDVVEVTFAPEVGSDTWLVSFNTQSKLPELLEKQMPKGRLGFGMSGWTQVGKLKFPTKFENLGMSESFEIANIEIGEPEDELFIPTVTQ